MTGFKNIPRIGYQRHGAPGSVAGTLIAIANGIVKPIAGTLSVMTWLCRGFYAAIYQSTLADKGEEADAENTIGLDASSVTDVSNNEQQQTDDISEPATTITAATGYKPQVCKQILNEFDDIKKQKAGIYSHEHNA